LKVPGGGRQWTKVAVVVAVAGSVAFGVYVAYLGWSYDSFPVSEKPFADYAGVASTSFNGTEVSFDVRWLSADFVPLKAQLTSPTTDAANSPPCWLDLKNVTSGEVIPMPFTISQPSSVLKDLSLYIAVKSVSTGEEFTIVHYITDLDAHPGNVFPSNYTCQEPAGQM
jgi:hypothetical protein